METYKNGYILYGGVMKARSGCSLINLVCEVTELSMEELSKLAVSEMNIENLPVKELNVTACMCNCVEVVATVNILLEGRTENIPGVITAVRKK